MLDLWGLLFYFYFKCGAFFIWEFFFFPETLSICLFGLMNGPTVLAFMLINNYMIFFYTWVPLWGRVGFDKMSVFGDNCWVSSGKYVFIIVKIKYVNSDSMSDICDKLNFTINYTQYTTTDKTFIRKHINLIMFDTRNGTLESLDS